MEVEAEAVALMAATNSAMGSPMRTAAVGVVVGWQSVVGP